MTGAPFSLITRTCAKMHTSAAGDAMHTVGPSHNADLVFQCEPGTTELSQIGDVSSDGRGKRGSSLNYLYTVYVYTYLHVGWDAEM